MRAISPGDQGNEGAAFASRPPQLIRGQEVAAGAWWGALPLSNQVLTLGWSGVLLLSAARTGGPPLIAAGQAAIYPYTFEGKRQTCQDNLRALYQAVSLYTQDYDGRFPPLETGSGGSRVTWVSVLAGQGEVRSFQCPSGRAIAAGTRPLWCSYVMNPILGGQNAEAVDDPAQTLLWAEGGDRHDVSLLPPFPSWPPGEGRGIEAVSSVAGGKAEPSGTAPSVKTIDAGDLNIAARHGDGANVLYADGHVESLTIGNSTVGNSTVGVSTVGVSTVRSNGTQNWEEDPVLWGGSAALRLSLQRIANRSASSRELVKQLRSSDGDSRGVVDGAATARYLRSHRDGLQATSADLLALWRLNRGASASETVDRVGWNLARAWQRVGEGSALGSLSRELGRRSQEELQNAEAAGTTAREVFSAAPPEGEAEVAGMVEAPANWKLEQKQTGRYGQTFLRSQIKDVFILCEIGERQSYHQPSPVDWSDMEARLKRNRGASYRRLSLKNGGALAGEEASTWEYEVNKPGSPRLRKLTVGHSGAWRSTVVACTAPAGEFEKWRPIFERVLSNFQAR